jgi:uncharacterized repeat protein (TIGR03803 family)
VAAAVLISAAAASAQPHFPPQPYFVALHAFSGGAGGAYPAASLIEGIDGNFYGTTSQGGSAGQGTVFKMDGAGTVTVLHSFAGAVDGSGPQASLIQATDGNFYGATAAGGAFNGGTVFQMTPSGTVTVLHAFTRGTDGSTPYASLLQATDGNFYGTTYEFGGAQWSRYGFGCGTVFKMDGAGTVTVLHSFAGGADGAYPFAPLIQAADGNFYGTTSAGGGAGCPVNGCGTVFKMTPSGSVTVLHAFTGGSDGEGPRGSLIQATDGAFYGTTIRGEASCCGAVFKMDGAGTLTVLHAFSGVSDGSGPGASLIQATDGNFYGTTQQAGAFGFGVAFRISAMPSGNMSFTADFDGDGKSDLVV